MTTANAPLLGELDLKYIHIALDRLAQKYDAQGEETAATEVRTLRARLEGQRAAEGIPPERQEAFQEEFMAAAAQGPEAAQAALQSWYEEVVRCEPNPPAVLAPILVQQMLNAGKQSAYFVIRQVGLKLEALEKRGAVHELGHWVVMGLENAQAGRDLWAADPDLVPG